MPKLITFKIPTEAGTREAQGYIAWLDVAGTRYKFVLQLDITKPTILTDYRTGFRLGSFAGMILARYVRSPYAYTESISGTYRKTAQDFLGTIIARHGADFVRARLAEKPTLNP
jgi:hypothetical protein